MSMQKSISRLFEISVKSVYVAAESRPEECHYFFAYKIQIKNTGQTTAQLISRHWTITNALGEIEEIRGPGVVGQQPRLQPGQSFEYESACPLNTSSGSMKGFYQMTSDHGETFKIEIPEFYLIAPQALH